MAFCIISPEQLNNLSNHIKESKELFESVYGEKIESNPVIYHEQDDIYYFFYQQNQVNKKKKKTGNILDFNNIDEVYETHSKEIEYVLQCYSKHKVVPLIWFRKEYYQFSNHDGPILTLIDSRKRYIKGYCNTTEPIGDEMIDEKAEIVREFSCQENIAMPIMYLLARDDYAFEHSLRVQKYVTYLIEDINKAILKNAIFSQYSLDDNEIQDLIYTGLIHDLGKVYCKDEILMKSTNLNLDDKYHINRHPIFSCGLLSFTTMSTLPENIILPILFHHLTPDKTRKILENYFPDTKSENIIKLNKAILTISILKVCDSLDSILSRKYDNKECISKVCLNLAKEYRYISKAKKENSKLPLKEFSQERNINKYKFSNNFELFIRYLIYKWLCSSEAHIKIKKQRYGLQFDIKEFFKHINNDKKSIVRMLKELKNTNIFN